MTIQSIWQQIAAHHDQLAVTHAAIRDLFAELDDEGIQPTDEEIDAMVAKADASMNAETTAPSALELFTGAKQGEPVYTMADDETFTREQYHAAGWTDDQLTSLGKMTITYPNPPAAAAPVAPPAPAAPTPPTAPSAPTTSNAGGSSTLAATNVLVDKAGVPWDARIHSSARTINEGDGLWKKRKGVSPQLVAQVTSELLSAKTPFVQPQAAPVAVAAPAAPAAPTPAVAPAAPGVPGTAKEAITQANALAAADKANHPDPTSFGELITWQKATGTQTQAIVAAAQQIDPAIAGLGFLARPEYKDLIPTIIELVKAG